VDVGRRKFDEDHGYSVYIADDVGSFESASSDNDSCMDPGEVGILVRKLGTALSQMCLNGGSDLKSAHTQKMARLQKLPRNQNLAKTQTMPGAENHL
jgi:hypothetical protein